MFEKSGILKATCAKVKRVEIVLLFLLNSEFDLINVQKQDSLILRYFVGGVIISSDVIRILRQNKYNVDVALAEISCKGKKKKRL